MFLKNAHVYVYFRKCLKQLQVRRWDTFCRKTGWVTTKFARYGEDPRCPQCKRIRTTGLTLDGLRLKRQKQKVDQNEETRLMRLFYYTPISRELFD